MTIEQLRNRWGHDESWIQEAQDAAAVRYGKADPRAERYNQPARTYGAMPRVSPSRWGRWLYEWKSFWKVEG